MTDEQARTLRCNSSFYDNRPHHCTQGVGHAGPHEDADTYWRDYQPIFESPGFIVTPKLRTFGACSECEEPELCASHGRCARAVLREAEQAVPAPADEQARTLRERLEALRLQILEWAQGVEDCAEGAHAGINAFIHDMRIVADSLTAPAEGACTCSEFGSGTQPCPVHGGSVETRTTAPAEGSQPMHILDELHAILTSYGIASRSLRDGMAGLPGDLIQWAADACRQSTKLTAPAEGSQENKMEDRARLFAAGFRDGFIAGQHNDEGGPDQGVERFRERYLPAVETSGRLYGTAPAEGVAPLPQEDEPIEFCLAEEDAVQPLDAQTTIDVALTVAYNTGRRANAPMPHGAHKAAMDAARKRLLKLLAPSQEPNTP